MLPTASTAPRASGSSLMIHTSPQPQQSASQLVKRMCADDDTWLCCPRALRGPESNTSTHLLRPQIHSVLPAPPPQPHQSNRRCPLIAKCCTFCVCVYTLYFCCTAALNRDTRVSVPPSLCRICQSASKYVSKYWWLKFTTHSDPGPPCVADLTCKHGQVKLELSEYIKYGYARVRCSAGCLLCIFYAKATDAFLNVVGCVPPGSW